MDNVWGAVIAVAGTLLGVVIVHMFERRRATAEHQRDDRERDRQERLAACIRFTTAATRYRRASLERWHRRQDRNGRDSTRARDDYYEQRDSALSECLRLRFLTHDDELVATATATIEAAAAIYRAASGDDMKSRNTETLERLDAFTLLAAERTRAW